MTIESIGQPVIVALLVATLVAAAKWAHKRIVGLVTSVEKIESAMPALLVMSKELAPNGGGSVKDKVNTIAEKMLFHEQARRLLVDMTTDIAYYECGPEGDCVYVNREWCLITGLTPNEAEGSGWVGGVHPDDRERVVEQWSIAVESGAEFSADYRMVDRAGEVTPVHGVARIIRSADGQVVGMIGYNKKK